MKIIISENQYNKLKGITEGKKATISHKAAPGTTNTQIYHNNTYDENKTKISLKNYLSIPTNNLKPGITKLYNSDNEELIFIKKENRRITYKKPNGQIAASLLDNLSIIP